MQENKGSCWGVNDPPATIDCENLWAYSGRVREQCCEFLLIYSPLLPPAEI